MKVWKNLFRKGDKINASEIAVAPGLMLPGAVIVESGSNANGDYVRFGDGTQICFLANVSFESRINTGSGTYADPYRSNIFNWTYPVSFKSYPAISVVTINSLANTPMSTVIRQMSASAASLQGIAMSDVGTDETVMATIIAIGRWK